MSHPVNNELIDLHQALICSTFKCFVLEVIILKVGLGIKSCEQLTVCSVTGMFAFINIRRGPVN